MISIKQIQSFPCESLVQLFDQYMVFYKKPSDPVRYEKYLRDRIENTQATAYIAYDQDEQAIGFVLNYHSFSSVSLGPIVVLNDLFVTKEARGKGAGESLIKRVFQLAKEKGAVRVDLGTAKDNHSAQRLYEKTGFLRDNDFCSYSYSISDQV